MGGGAGAGAAAAAGAVRHVTVHEPVVLETLHTYGIPTPEYYIASTPEEAQHWFRHTLNQRE